MEIMRILFSNMLHCVLCKYSRTQVDTICQITKYLLRPQCVNTNKNVDIFTLIQYPQKRNLKYHPKFGTSCT